MDDDSLSESKYQNTERNDGAGRREKKKVEIHSTDIQPIPDWTRLDLPAIYDALVPANREQIETQRRWLAGAVHQLTNKPVQIGIIWNQMIASLEMKFQLREEVRQALQTKAKPKTTNSDHHRGLFLWLWDLLFWKECVTFSIVH